MLFPLLVAVFFHECGHILFLLLTGGRLKGVRVGIFGITLKADYPPSYPAKILISLGGPIVGIVCFFHLDALFPKLNTDQHETLEILFLLTYGFPFL